MSSEALSVVTRKSGWAAVHSFGIFQLQLTPTLVPGMCLSSAMGKPVLSGTVSCDQNQFQASHRANRQSRLQPSDMALLRKMPLRLQALLMTLPQMTRPCAQVESAISRLLMQADSLLQTNIRLYSEVGPCSCDIAWFRDSLLHSEI